MQRARKDFAARGLGVAAITYDNQQTLEDFAERKGIDYPLLADPTSDTIRRFGLLDPDHTSGNVPPFGAPNVAYPGFFVLDRAGVVKERFVDGRYDDRRTANGIVGALFPESLTGASRPVEAQHLGVALSQSDREVVPGNRLTLAVELALPPDCHVYAPEVRGYAPLALVFEPTAGCEFAPVSYPPAKKLRFEALQEELPVLEGRVLLREEFVLTANAALLRRLQDDPAHQVKVSVRAVLRYQACSREQCFPPCEVPLGWEVVVKPLDLEQTDPLLRKPAK